MYKIYRQQFYWIKIDLISFGCDLIKINSVEMFIYGKMGNILFL